MHLGGVVGNGNEAVALRIVEASGRGAAAYLVLARFLYGAAVIGRAPNSDWALRPGPVTIQRIITDDVHPSRAVAGQRFADRFVEVRLGRNRSVAQHVTDSALLGNVPNVTQAVGKHRVQDVARTMDGAREVIGLKERERIIAGGIDLNFLVGG